MDRRKVAPLADDFKAKVHQWLRQHIGEPVGPDGKHIPIPHLRTIEKPICAECASPADNHLTGWFANGDRVEIPLCGSHSAAALSFIARRKQELVDRDNRIRQSIS